MPRQPRSWTGIPPAASSAAIWGMRAAATTESLEPVRSPTILSVTPKFAGDGTTKIASAFPAARTTARATILSSTDSGSFRFSARMGDAAGKASSAISASASMRVYRSSASRSSAFISGVADSSALSQWTHSGIETPGEPSVGGTSHWNPSGRTPRSSIGPA